MRLIGRGLYISDSLETYLKFKGILGDYIKWVKNIPLDVAPLNVITHMGALTEVGINLLRPKYSIHQPDFGNSRLRMSKTAYSRIEMECHWIVSGLAITGEHPPLNGFIKRYSSTTANVTGARAFYVECLAGMHPEPLNALGAGNIWATDFMELTTKSVKPSKPNPNKLKEVI